MLHNLPTIVTVKDALDAYFKIKCDLLSNYESDNDDDETVVVKCDGGVKWFRSVLCHFNNCWVE